MATKALALETCKCFYSNDGGGGAEHQLVISSSSSEKAHEVHHSSGRETANFACHAISVWNMFKALRSVTTLHTLRNRS
ncbi:Hypothetical protein FKW44_005583 [Caligus rogercresseyi]|uniref:Uncharacterized protein n=1 Tax=Caligus rogercresseyi TaxID=217165 RepID=A0A7T8KC73_CALRO|nr:Hypothetical protein FKW44_005583 [Caligus rogercresseyi]